MTQVSGSRGFAAMDPEKQRAIASKGGRAAHALGKAHEFDTETARAAGRKGGEIVSRNRQHMAEIGAKGGRARGNAQRAMASVTRLPEPAQPAPESPAKESSAA